MSARVTGKGRPKAASSAKSPDAQRDTPRAAGVQAVDAEATVAGLKAQLAAARAHIAQLEQRQAEILSRLDDIIGSIESLPQDES